MSDPGTDPAHDLVDYPQDEPQPRIRLGTFLALLRVLAGRRGDAGLVWTGGGFTYTVLIAREATFQAPVVIDADPEALGGDVARRRIRDALA